MNPIVVGVDGSAEAIRAVRLAAELAAAIHAKLVLVYAVPPVTYGAEWMLVPAGIYDGLNAAGEAELRRATDLARCSDAEQVVLQGSPAETLVKVASERQASMLVVGSHGRGAVARMLIGSVADRVAHLAHCPVLVVRAAA